jgi:hypothetical protein
VTEPEPIGDGTLKLIVLDTGRSLAAEIEAALRVHVRSEELRPLGDRAFIVYTDAAPADIRDWLAPLLLDVQTVLVTEFERWSARGDAVDRRWLLRRGH